MNILQKIALFVIFSLFIGCKNQSSDSKLRDKFDNLLKESEEDSLNETQRKQRLDSAYTYLLEHNNDSINRYNFRRLAIAYYNMNMYDSSIRVGKKLSDLSIEAKDSIGFAKGLYYTAQSYYGNSNNDSAFIYYSKAEKVFGDLKDYRSLGEIKLYKAYIYHDIGEYFLCETGAFTALKQLKKENRVIDMYNCYNLIASALDGQDDNEGALKYYESALKQLDVFRDEGYSDSAVEFYKATCYNNMGGVYVKEENYQKAISLYKEAMQLPSIKREYISLYAKLLNNLAYAKFKSGDDSELPKLFYDSLRIRDSVDNQQGIIASNINIGEYYASKQDTAKAIKYLTEAYGAAKEIKSNYDILNSLKLLAEFDKEKGIYYSNQYIKLNDDLQDIARANRDKYARIEYETEKLQDEKDALAKKNSFIIGISAIILLFVAAIFIIYYLNSRNKELLLIQEQQKANEEVYLLMNEQQAKIDLARKDEKNRIAMELHDGILNNIYAVRLNLDFINKKSDDESILKRKELIKELQTVEAEIRAVSHDLSKNAMLQQEKSFENILEYMISNQKNAFNTVFEASIDHSIDWESLSNILKVNIYRIIQEALQNINKYSKANFARVIITKEEDNITVTVIDDGVGFDTQSAKGGIGLKNLNKRALALNGNIEITSQPGTGSTIKVTFPV